MVVGKSSNNLFHRLLDVKLEAVRLLGERDWSLLSSFGKMKDGPRAGLYVGGIPFEEQLDLARSVARGDTVYVHLMHRHKSGIYESSMLRRSSCGLVMVFADREELA